MAIQFGRENVVSFVSMQIVRFGQFIYTHLLIPVETDFFAKADQGLANVLWIPVGIFFAMTARKPVRFLARKWSRLSARIWRAAAEDQKMSTESFSYAGIRESVSIIDFNPQGYGPSDILSFYVDKDPGPPEEWKAEYEEAVKQIREEEEQGRIFNGQVLALHSFQVGRTPEDERQSLILRFYKTDYIDKRSVLKVFHGLPSETRDRLLVNAREQADPFFSKSFGIQVALITADEKFIFAKRSENTIVNPGKFICGIAEGMGTMDVESGVPSIFRTAMRGLTEEFGVSLRPADYTALKVTTFMLDQDYYEFVMAGVVDFRKKGDEYTFAYYQEKFAAGITKDKWETNKFIAVPLDVGEIIKFIATNDLTNYAIVATIYALLSIGDFHDREVRAACRKFYPANRRASSIPPQSKVVSNSPR